MGKNPIQDFYFITPDDNRQACTSGNLHSNIRFEKIIPITISLKGNTSKAKEHQI